MRLEKLDKLYAKAQLIQGYKIVIDDGRAHGLVVDLPTDTSEIPQESRRRFFQS